MIKKSSGLTILESLVVMAVCVILLWVAVPVAMVRLGYKDVGAMVVTEGDKAPEDKDLSIDPDVFKPRVENVPKSAVLPASQFVPRPPVAPKQPPLEK